MTQRQNSEGLSLTAVPRVQVPHLDRPPSIDGRITWSEWRDGSKITRTFKNSSETRTHQSNIFLGHDGTHLYLGINSGFRTGWDNHAMLYFDGDNDDVITGQKELPHPDIKIGEPGPGAWDGYDRYQLLTNSDRPSRPPSLEKDSDDPDRRASYEFKIPFRSFGVQPGDTIGVNIRIHTPDHGKEERFYWPDTPQTEAGVENWADFALAPTATPTRTPTATGTPIPTVTATTGNGSYNLKGGKKTEIAVGDTTYYLITDIPGTDPERKAVTTAAYDVVAQPEARQAILVDTYLNELGYIGRFDERARRNLIKNAKRKAAAWSQAEIGARVGDVAADILAAWASAHAGITTHAYAEVLDALDSVIVWGSDWAEDSYKRQFTEMMMACRNVEWMKMETEEVKAIGADAPGVVSLLTTLVEAYESFEDTRDVLVGWQLLRGSARTSGVTSDFLFATGTLEIAEAAEGIFLGLVIDKSFGEVDGFFEVTAEIDGIMHAYQTVRRSIHQRLLEIENTARGGTLTPGQIYEFEILNYTRHQVRTMAHHFAAKRIEELANDDLSFLWDAMINAQQNYEQYTATADTHAWLAKAHCNSWGGREKAVRQHLKRSINVEVMEE